MATPLSKTPVFKTPSAAAALRVQDLLSRMTLAEKTTQMMCVWQKQAQKLVDAAGNFKQSHS